MCSKISAVTIVRKGKASKKKMCRRSKVTRHRFNCFDNVSKRKERNKNKGER